MAPFHNLHDVPIINKVSVPQMGPPGPTLKALRKIISRSSLGKNASPVLIVSLRWSDLVGRGGVNGRVVEWWYQGGFKLQG